ncbi:MAG: radical SAM protein [Candidatus Omnitrophica bacterium]|nr:radical SAM protein [Candidatus Omnitrophota bacterium]
MILNRSDLRNFLFFLNEIHPLSIEDSLLGAATAPSSWEEVKTKIRVARKNDSFVRSIKRVQIYIHVPFCGRLCKFCHCARILLRRRSEINTYIDSVSRQMMFLSSAYQGMSADTLCFGGGTPSILNAQQLTAILDGVDEAFPNPQRKILFEINPSSWSASKLAVLSARGLYRLSIGVQSLDDKVLRNVSRSQTRKKVLWCLRSARKAKVPYVNVDLMAGLPGQTTKGFMDDLEVLLDEGANVVHVYPYCDPTGQILRRSQDEVKDFFKKRDSMMKLGSEALVKAGFSRKGLGAYTQTGAGEEHQEEAYTTLESAVAGFGPFAKSQFPGAVYYSSGALRAGNNLPSVALAQHDKSYAMSHYAAIAIMDGLNEKVFARRFGVSLEKQCGEALRFLQQEGLVTFSKGVWKFSGKWEIRRIREYIVLTRILFGQRMVDNLRRRFADKYDPQHDYSGGNSLLKAYSNSWLMTLYYRMGV